MYQETTLTSTVSTELTASLQQTLGGAKIRELETAVRLPESRGGFLWFFLSTAIVCAGIVVYILFSVQLYRIETELAGLQTQYHSIERRNAELIWAIEEESSLVKVQTQAANLGYVAPQNRLYVTSIGD